MLNVSERLGKGFSGTIERVQGSDGQMLARKRAHSDEAKAQLTHEYLMLCRLEHPNIIVIIRGQVALSPLDEFQMTLYDTDLKRYILSVPPISNTIVYRILEQISSAVSYIHGEGIVHCDLKPENILYNLSSQTAVLADFGFAAEKTADDWWYRVYSHDDFAKGTPLWMAPERLLYPRLIHPASDVWALALTGYFLFSGHEPWRTYKHFDRFSSDLLDNILICQLEQPALCGKQLWQYFQKCWAFSYKERPTAEEFNSTVHLAKYLIN